MRDLDRVIEWYRVALGSQNIVKKLMENPEEFPLEGVFAALPLSQSKHLLAVAEKELHDLTILSLVSIFEQNVLEYLKAIIDGNMNKHNPLLVRVNKYLLEKAQYWHFKDILDFFKSVIDSDFIGEIKQIYDYRSKVAHNKPREINLDPFLVYERLSQFNHNLKSLQL